MERGIPPLGIGTPAVTLHRFRNMPAHDQCDPVGANLVFARADYISVEAIQSWISVFERFFMLFSINPGLPVPYLLVEAKAADVQPSAPLKKFQQVLNVPAVQLVNEGEGYRIFTNGEQKIVVAPAWLWLAGLP